MRINVHCATKVLLDIILLIRFDLMLLALVDSDERDSVSLIK